MPIPDRRSSKFSVHHRCYLVSEPALLVDVQGSSLILANGNRQHFFFFSVSVKNVDLLAFNESSTLIAQINYFTDAASFLRYLKLGFLYMLQNFVTAGLKTAREIHHFLVQLRLPHSNHFCDNPCNALFVATSTNMALNPALPALAEAQVTWCSTNAKQAKPRGSPNTATK